MHPLLDDPWVSAQIDAAVAPYVGRLSAGEVAWMREQLAETLAEGGKAEALLRRAQPAVVEQSGEVRRPGTGAVVTPIGAARRSKAAG